MTDEIKITIAIPTFQRYGMTINAFSKVIDDERISEVVINDDCSTDDSCQRLVEYFKGNPKVKVFRNQKNEDCYRNKAISVHKATNEFVILFDSDNTVDTSYLDALYAIKEWDAKTIYQPSYARPHFDFRQWSGLIITKENVAQYINTHLMTSLNAANHFVNKEQFLKVWNGRVNPGSSDSIFFQTCWLEASNKTYITPNLEYEHFISDKGDGHYQTQSHKYVKFHELLMNRIKQLR